MAVDTEQKRFSMMNSFSVVYTPLFVPDGTIGANDRGHLLHLYSGNAFDSPAVALVAKINGLTIYHP